MPHGSNDLRPPRILLAAASLAGAVALAVVLGSAWTQKAAHPKHEASPSALTEAPAATPAAVVATAAPPVLAIAPYGPMRPPAGETALGVSPGTAGMLVGIVPETGKPGRPSQSFRQRLANENAMALDRSMNGLTVVTRPDGVKEIDLKGRFQNFMVVHLTPEGRKVESCVEGPEVEAALRQAPAPAPAPALPEK
ncbi:MAG: post-PEP-CTERM-1 domain-containing protein [Hyphomicrobiales bacterium]